MRLRHAFLSGLAVLCLGTITSADDLVADPSFSWDGAKWIWRALPEGSFPYNDTVIFRRVFTLPESSRVILRITADTAYRALFNGQWVGDGPARSWPEHYQYDRIDMTAHARKGENELVVIAKFFGIGTFHQLPQEPGLLAAIEAEPQAGGKPIRVVSDRAWEVREAPEWIRWVPKQSVQMGLFEVYDARLERQDGFTPAVEKYAAGEGPWRNLWLRDVPMLTRIPRDFRALQGVCVVRRSDWRTFIFPTAPWLYNAVVPTNNHSAVTGVYAVMVDLDAPGTLQVDAGAQSALVDGRRVPPRGVLLQPGRHLLQVGLSRWFSHWHYDTEIRMRCDQAFRLSSPVDGSTEKPWIYHPVPDGKYLEEDWKWSLLSDAERATVETRLKSGLESALRQWNQPGAYRETPLPPGSRAIGPDEWTEAAHWLFTTREPLREAPDAVSDTAAFLAGTAPLEVRPQPDGDVELVFDLDEQDVGYYQLDIEGEAGLVVDFAGVEYIAPDGRVQHTGTYRNAMRYICREGRQTFTSLSRRSQRYLFVTLRNQSRPAVIHGLRLIESTYPVEPIGSFACSDPLFTRTWDISARTLKLCMEDTFTDCPLYEQTLWVGDARNESVFAYTAFGATDIARRCIRLAAWSLEKYPIVLCQVPSTWGVLLPAWSFLWSVMVRDYYDYTGDLEFARWAYPWMVRNLQGAASYSDSRGLFSAPFWNMFDWTGIDDGHATVTHNSLFAIGATDAAIAIGEAIGDTEHLDWLRDYRKKLQDAVEGLWDAERGTYPDAVRGDGTPSPKTCVHTAFLALLYDAAPPERRERLLDIVLRPAEGVTRLGSPFAAMYQFEALEKCGRIDAILDAIREYYGPMIAAGATTVWESFPSGTTGGDGFPTRSHTHAWSSAPIHFLNRLVLGIVPETPGGTRVRVSPWIRGLEWAKGSTALAKGPVSVDWRVEDGTLRVTVTAPDGVTTRFERNETHEGLRVVFNGQDMP